MKTRTIYSNGKQSPEETDRIKREYPHDEPIPSIVGEEPHEDSHLVHEPPSRPSEEAPQPNRYHLNEKEYA